MKPLMRSIFGTLNRGPRRQAPKPNPPLPLRRRLFTSTLRRPAGRPQPADDPGFRSIVDQPAILVRSGTKHGYGLIILAVIPVTAFALGTWQVKRLAWKSKLLAEVEDRIARPPLPLPSDIDPEVINDFNYRRILATGTFRHDREMLVGPRMKDGEEGYFVVTPLERVVIGPSGVPDGKPSRRKGSTVLVNRGWISKRFRDQRERGGGMENEEVIVEGLIREPWKKNMFTPDNRPDKSEFYFPDVAQMAELASAQPVWIEQTTEPDMLGFMDKKDKGIPIARAAVIDIRNNHAQYIFTWYSLSLATAIMFYLVVRKPPSNVARRVRTSQSW